MYGGDTQDLSFTLRAGPDVKTHAGQNGILRSAPHRGRTLLATLHRYKYYGRLFRVYPTSPIS